MKKPVATINAVIDGKIYTTIRTSARGTALAGSLVTFDAGKQKMLCSIGNVDRTNLVHQSSTFQPLIMEQGQIPHFSNVTDVETAILTLIACYDSESQALAPKRFNPPSGTEVHQVSSSEIDLFMREKTHFVNIGTLPSDPAGHLSVVNRHHGELAKGGYGEARHELIVGQTGAGKTVLATTLLAAKLVAYPDMGAFIPDTSGDLTHSKSFNKGAEFQFNWHELLARGGRDLDKVDINDVRLESQYAFQETVAPLLEKWLSMDPGYADTLVNYAWDRLPAGTTTANVTFEEFLRICQHEVPKVYASGGNKKAERIGEILGDHHRLAILQAKWNHQVAAFFQIGHYTITDLLDKFLLDRKIVVLSMKNMREKQQRFVMIEIFNQLLDRVAGRFRATGEQDFNSTIVLDEAARWVPQDNDKDGLRDKILDGLRTSRKYGLGWLIINQRLAPLHKDVLTETHTKFLGRGLGIGADEAHLLTLLGKEGKSVYDMLKLQGGYYWLVSGLDINLGGDNNPFMAVKTYGGNATEAIIQANPHIWRKDN